MLNNLYPTTPIPRRPAMKNIVRAGITAAALSLGLTRSLSCCNVGGWTSCVGAR
jgi:hypothetical protein